MKRLRQREFCYVLGPFQKPTLIVEPPETIVVETEDAFGGKIKTEKDLPTPDRVALPFVNPQTGPIYVKGAQKGDTLIVHIKDIKPASDQGATCLVPYFGGLTSTTYTRLLNAPLPTNTKICPIRDGKVYFSDKIVLPLEPIIGTIGVSPEIEAVSSLTPGMHGGNMDCPDVCIGNKLFLPVFVEGALLYLGDVHAVQGDGELCGVAVEVPAECTLTVDLIKGKTITWPRIESPDYIMTVGSCKPMEDAMRIAFTELVLWLEGEYGFNLWDAYQLCTQVAKVRLAQMVNPLYTMVAKFPKKYLPSG